MEKTGRQRIPDYKRARLSIKCQNCGKEAAYKVTYEDMYSKLTVTLCEECEKLGYGQLRLQSQIEWPAEAVKA
jgi:RNase P subunit RPR2